MLHLDQFGYAATHIIRQFKSNKNYLPHSFHSSPQFGRVFSGKSDRLEMCVRDEECFGVLRLNLGDDFGLAVMVFSL